MKNKIFFIILFFVFVLLLSNQSINAQTYTELFTGMSSGATSFTSNTYTFNLTSKFKIHSWSGWGHTGDSEYIGNDGSDVLSAAGIVGSITNSSNNFYIYSVWIWPSDASVNQPKNTGDVIFRGKKTGSTQFTQTVLAATINTNINSERGYTFVDFGSTNGSKLIDQLEVEVTSGLRYITIDDFKFSINTPFPVELTSFTGVANGNVVTLNWATATEVNNYGFNVERCKMQGTREDVWETIGFVQGHGNSNSPKSYSFVDKPTAGTKFQYRLKQIDFDGKYEYSPVVDVLLEIPSELVLKQNFPNPFNPSTEINYQLPVDGFVSLKVCDILGREIIVLVNEFQQAGSYKYPFSINNLSLSSGVYIYTLKANGITLNKKMLLSK